MDNLLFRVAGHMFVLYWFPLGVGWVWCAAFRAPHTRWLGRGFVWSLVCGLWLGALLCVVGCVVGLSVLSGLGLRMVGLSSSFA